MKLNKKEGIVFLEKSGLPTIKRLKLEELSSDSPELQKGLSVRLSPKKDSNVNLYLPSIHNCKDLFTIKEFVNKNKEKYDIIIHKTVKPEIIGSVSKLSFRENVVLETYKNFEERKKEIINNRMIIPILGDRMFISKLEMLNYNKDDFADFAKVIKYLDKVHFEEYDMEYVKENNKIIFTDLTLPDNRDYNSFKESMADKEVVL